MSDFQNAGYKKVESLIDAQTIETVSQYFENKISRGEWQSNSESIENAASKLGYYADPLIEVMLKQCQPAIEQHTGLLLEPTYSFSRVYQGGEELKPHTDRPSCEISVTINVACTGDIWPIWMQYANNDPVKCMLNPSTEAGDEYRVQLHSLSILVHSFIPAHHQRPEFSSTSCNRLSITTSFQIFPRYTTCSSMYTPQTASYIACGSVL